MLKEVLVLGRGDRVFQDRRDLFPSEQNAALQREISDLLAIVGVELGHHVGAIVFERADFRQIRGVNKHQPGGGAQQDDAHENRIVNARRPASLRPRTCSVIEGNRQHGIDRF